MEEPIHEDPTPLLVYVGPLNRLYTSEVLRCLLREALCGVGISVQRQDIEVQRMGRFVCAAVRLGENTTYQTVAEKLRHVSAVDPDLLKELVMQDKTLVVSKDGKNFTAIKVMRLTVHPCQQQAEPMLYETDKGKVYLRRDGSVEGPLTGSAVQEWCRKKWTTELKKREETMDVLLKEKASLQQHIRSLEEQQRQIANSPKVQSKACITM
ncbi:uncharacterized protein LOC142496845 [Ascaphus truei]|uniref:uncharacterized protein LOC142483592 n=1 Tax=Ascaphus truei TaxID=8439 RepID=UPI003F59CFEA